jgi:hypothetical protein
MKLFFIGLIVAGILFAIVTWSERATMFHQYFEPEKPYAIPVRIVR